VHDDWEMLAWNTQERRHDRLSAGATPLEAIKSIPEDSDVLGDGVRAQEVAVARWDGSCDC
jgi:hypothetical protein